MEFFIQGFHLLSKKSFMSFRWKFLLVINLYVTIYPLFCTFKSQMELLAGGVVQNLSDIYIPTASLLVENMYYLLDRCVFSFLNFHHTFSFSPNTKDAFYLWLLPSAEILNKLHPYDICSVKIHSTSFKIRTPDLPLLIFFFCQFTWTLVVWNSLKS